MEIEMTTSDFVIVLLTAFMVYIGFTLIWIGMYWGLLVILFNVKAFDVYCLKRKYDNDTAR